MCQKLGGDENPQTASALINLGEARSFQGDAAGAEPLLRQALQIRKKTLPSGHPNVIAAQVRLGEVLTAEDKPTEAEPILREALGATKSAPFPLLPWQIAEVQSALGTCLIALHRTSEGEPLLKSSQADLQKDPRPAFRTPRQIPKS
jgi:tetratricopeptide (TPR) repeat protein